MATITTTSCCPLAPQNLHFVIYPAQLAPFHYKSPVMLTLVTTKQSLYQAIFEISSADTINPKLFSLASGKLFGQGQKAATYFTKISQEQSLGKILNFFSPETS